MGLTKVDEVLVESIVKRKQPKKPQYDFVLHLDWNDGVTTTIYRDYERVLNLQRKLRKLKDNFAQQKHSNANVLAKFLRETTFPNSSTVKTGRQALKKIAPVEEFLKSLIHLPSGVSESEPVIEFFRPVPEDMIPPDNNCSYVINSQKEQRDSKPKNYISHISEPILLEQYVAICDYEMREEIGNGLKLKAGNIVDVIQKNEHGWWFVDLDGQLGWAPASYLEPRDGSMDEHIMDIYEDGEEEMYIVMATFEPEFDDEIPLQLGQVVKVKQKSFDGWWLVMSDEELGWAPAMHLREVCTSSSNARQKGRQTALRTMLRDVGRMNSLYNITGQRRTTWDPPARKQIMAGKRSVVRRDPNANVAAGAPNSSYVNLEFHQKSSASPLKAARKRGKDSANNDTASSGPSYMNMAFHEKNKGHTRQRVRRRAEEEGDLGVIDFDKVRTSSSGSQESDNTDTKPRTSSLGSQESDNTDTKKRPLSFVSEEGDQASQTSSSQASSSQESNSKERTSTESSAEGVQQPPEAQPDKGTPEKDQGSEFTPKDATEAEITSAVVEVAKEEEVKIKIEKPEKEPLIFYALGAYKKDEDTEVNLTEGTPVEVLEQTEGGWWLVRTQSFSIGWAPSNYLDENPEASFCVRRPRSQKKPPKRPPKSPGVLKKAMQVTAEQRFWKFVKKGENIGAQSLSTVPKEKDDDKVEVEVNEKVAGHHEGKGNGGDYASRLGVGPKYDDDTDDDDTDDNEYDYPDTRELQFENYIMELKRKSAAFQALPAADEPPTVEKKSEESVTIEEAMTKEREVEVESNENLDDEDAKGDDSVEVTSF